MKSHPSSARTIRDQLLLSMKEGEYADCARLPRESILADKLGISRQIPVGSPVLLVSRLCTADGQPAIYCEDILPKDLIQKDYTSRDLRLPIFHFLQNFCGTTSYLDLTNLHPAVADARLAEIFHLPVGAPLLWMDEVDYDIEGNPVFCSNEYFADGFFCHTVVRKKL